MVPPLGTKPRVVLFGGAVLLRGTYDRETLIWSFMGLVRCRGLLFTGFTLIHFPDYFPCSRVFKCVVLETFSVALYFQKGFPESLTLDTLQEFFEGFGKVESIFMRRLKDKTAFKGSVFVTFTDLDSAKIFVEKEGIKHGDTELIRMFKYVSFT
jgi:hypothetical protein